MIGKIELLKKVLTGELHDESFWQRIKPSAVRGKINLKRLVLRNALAALERRGYRVYAPTRPGVEAKLKRALGRDHPVVGFTMVGKRRLDNVEDCIREVVAQQVEGSFVECGVWRGGVGILAKAVLDELGANREVWLCDSFQGLPGPTFEQDAGYDFRGMNDYLGVPRSEVAANFERFGLLDNRVRFLEGYFSDSLPIATIGKIAVLRLDGDLYESTWQCLTALYRQVSVGGYVIIDDYGVLEPCRQAVHDFFDQEGISPVLREIDGTGVFWQVQ